jgi:hypothetical protein
LEQWRTPIVPERTARTPPADDSARQVDDLQPIVASGLISSGWSKDISP